MKRQIHQPIRKDNNIDAIIEYLIENGMSDFNANQFVHLNLLALGDMNMLRAAQEGKWNDIWAVAELYIAGDLF